MPAAASLFAVGFHHFASSVPVAGRRPALLLLFVALFAATALRASEGEEPVKITAPAAVLIAPGKSGAVRLALKIEEPWHIYSTVAQMGPRGSGPEPTTVTVTGSKAVRREGALSTSKLTRYLDPNFDMEVAVLEGDAWIDVPLTVDAGAAPASHEVELTVSFQACDDQTCLPPQEVKVRTKVIVK